MADEILELNNEISTRIFQLNLMKEEIPDIRDLKDEADEYLAWSDLYDLNEKLKEVIDLIDALRMNYEYE